MVYIKDQVANSKCMELIWYECKGELIICERKFWRIVRYPWGEVNLYLIKKDLMVLKKDV